MPETLEDTKLNKNKATEPLTPISVIAIVGIIDNTNNIVVVNIRKSMYDTFTSKTSNKIKN